MPVTIYELVARFERDMEPVRLPHFGQLSFMGRIDLLLEGMGVRRPRDFVPALVSPELRQSMEKAFEAGTLAEEAAQGFATEVPARWFDAEDGWKMAVVLLRNMDSTLAEMTGVQALGGRLRAEVEHLAELLGQASIRSIRFVLSLQECDDPPPELRQWVDDDFARLAATIRELLEQNGIEVTE